MKFFNHCGLLLSIIDLKINGERMLALRICSNFSKCMNVHVCSIAFDDIGLLMHHKRVEEIRAF